VPEDLDGLLDDDAVYDAVYLEVSFFDFGPYSQNMLHIGRK
jgi:hypothetical protein